MATSTRTRRNARMEARTTVSPADEMPLPAEPLPGQRTLNLAHDRPARRPNELVPVRPGLIDFLKSLDATAFLDNWSRKDLFDRVKAKYGEKGKGRVKQAELKAALDVAMDYWGVQKLLPETKSILLDDDQWREIKRAAAELLPEMTGRTIRQCVRIMRTKVACNHIILEGLPKRFHVWQGKTRG